MRDGSRPGRREDGRRTSTHLVEEPNLGLTPKLSVGSGIVAVDESFDQVRDTEDLEHPETMLQRRGGGGDQWDAYGLTHDDGVLLTVRYAFVSPGTSKREG